MGRMPTIKTILEKLDKDISDAKGSLDEWTFKDYVFVFIFYRFLSDNIIKYIKNTLNKDYTKMNDDEGEKYKFDIIENLRYYIRPSELFQNVIETLLNSRFLYGNLITIFNSIAKTSNELKDTFKIINSDSKFLGLEEDERSERVAKILIAIDKIRYDIEDANNDTLGDIYEYFLGKYNSKHGHKTGTFYTPTSLAELAINISSLYIQEPKNVFDPTCGTGSLLINYLKHNKNVSVYGIEQTIDTYGICKMNMLLRKIKDYNIINANTLICCKDEWEEKFDLILANPPFNISWNSSLIEENDKKYHNVPLPKNSKADWAFIYPIIYYLNKNGVAIVIDTPNMLNRKDLDEVSIRKYLVENNLIDTVIQLPKKLFTNVEKDVCIMVLRKNKEDNNILFLDAYKSCSKKGKNNILADSDINLITSYIRARETKPGNCYLANIAEIAQNNYLLEVKQYVPYEHIIKQKIYDIGPIEKYDNPDQENHAKLDPLDVQIHYYNKEARKYATMIQELMESDNLKLKYLNLGNKKYNTSFSVTSGLNPRGNFYLNKTNEYYYLSVAEIENGKIHITKNTGKINRNGLEKLKEKVGEIEIGDILFAVGEHTIKSVVIEEQYQNVGFNENIYIIKYNKEIVDPYYLRNIIQSNKFLEWANSNLANGEVKRIGLTEFRTYPFPIIPIEEQRKIGVQFKKLEEFHRSILRRITNELNKQNASYMNNISLLNKLYEDDE